MLQIYFDDDCDDDDDDEDVFRHVNILFHRGCQSIDGDDDDGTFK